jgi:hypothetical protein
VPPLTAEGAASLYAAFLTDACAGYRALAATRVFVYVAPPGGVDDVAPFVGPVAGIWHQTGPGLGERMESAFDDAFREGCAPVVIVGTDHPTLPLRLLSSAFDLLESKQADLVIGPAADGGYYALGMREMQRGLLAGMRYSHDGVRAETLARAMRAGLRVEQLETWYDVDDGASLARLARDLRAIPPGDPAAPPLRHTRAALKKLGIDG